MRQRFLLLLLPLLLLSCSQIELDETKHRVTLHISGYTMTPFSRAATTVDANSDVTHIDLVLFDADGSKVIKINQRQGDNNFGAPSITLAEGNYTLVVIAHSGSGVATITSPTEVTFPNNKVTDTFYSCQQISIRPETSSLDVMLHRAVSMVRIHLKDSSYPAGFSILKLYYTGGSSTFNPTTGYGSKDSRQTEYRTLVPVGASAEETLKEAEIYTFPHEEEGTLKITLTPQDSEGNDLPYPGKTLEAVPIRLNYITDATGLLFTTADAPFSLPIQLCFDTSWAGTSEFEF